jgi:hypothetical protein
MYLSGNRRRVAGGLVAAVVGLIGSVAAVAAPAGATGGWSNRYAVTSAHDTEASKSAVASCPDGELVHSTGGRINDGAGGVALKAIVPNAALTSVTVEGAARIGHPGSWSVTAFAVCYHPGQTDPVRVGSGGVIGNTATATCHGGKRLLGVGFDLLTSLSFVDEVVPGESRTDVTVRALGSGIVVGVKAYGICAHWVGIGPLDATSAFDDTSPKLAETPDHYSDALFVVGGRVNGGGGKVLLDALVPPGERYTARASAAVASSLPFSPIEDPALLRLARSGSDGEEDDEWSTTVYGSYDWY